MIQNKVVADLLQHRAEALAACDAWEHKFPVLKSVTDAAIYMLQTLVSAPAFFVGSGLAKGESEANAAFDRAFNPITHTFAFPFTEFSIVTCVDDQQAVVVVCYDQAKATNATLMLFLKEPQMPWVTYPPVCFEPVVGEDGMYYIRVGAYVTKNTEENIKAALPEGLHDDNVDTATKLLEVIGNINCQSVSFVRLPITTKAGTSLQSTAKSKALWEYHEVKLSDVPGHIYQPKGGTHASPRWHMRRGHWRKYKTGKRVWIDNMEVGDKSLGVVAHDYVVTCNQMEV